MILVVMGVSGCGKNCVGRILADKLEVKFYDADDFHSPENVSKMQSGIPLEDSDRMPWLEQLAKQMSGWEKNGGAVLACSALKKSYREILTQGGNVRFVYLKGEREIILARMKDREGHYMPESLLDSQFATLEEPDDAVEVAIDTSPEEIVQLILKQL